MQPEDSLEDGQQPGDVLRVAELAHGHGSVALTAGVKGRCELGGCQADN